MRVASKISLTLAALGLAAGVVVYLLASDGKPTDAGPASPRAAGAPDALAGSDLAPDLESAGSVPAERAVASADHPRAPAPSATDASTVSLLLVDASGDPVTGARVRLTVVDVQTDVCAWSGETESAEDGSASFEQVPLLSGPRDFGMRDNLIIRHPDHGERSLALAAREGMRVVLHELGSLDGRVVGDVTGEPIHDARVRWDVAPGASLALPEPRTAVTDVAGAFRLESVPCAVPLTITIAREGHLPHGVWHTLAEGASEPLIVRVPEPQAVAIRVIDQVTGAGVAHATISTGPFRLCATDEVGSATLFASRRQWELCVSSAPHLPTAFTLPELPAAKFQDPLVLPLLPACGIRGKIVGPQGGAPLQNVIVHALPAPGSALAELPPALWRSELLGAARLDQGAPEEVATNADGGFALDGLPPATNVRLLIKPCGVRSAPQHDLASVRTSDAGTVVDVGTLVFSKEWAVVQGAVIRGKGVFGATVMLEGEAGLREGRTDTSGNFSFSCVPPGSYSLTAHDDLGQVAKPVEVQPARRQDFVLLMPDSNQIVTEGVVVNPRGEAVPRQFVGWTTAAGVCSFTLSGDDGRFRIVTRSDDGGRLTLSAEAELAVPPLEVVPGRRDVRFVVPAMVTFYVALEVDAGRPLMPVVSLAWRRTGAEEFATANGVEPVMHGGRPIVAIRVPEDAHELRVGRSEEGTVGVTLDVSTLSRNAAAPTVVRLP